MAIYAVGDVQGCYQDLRNKLDEVEFDPKKDTLWLSGDLVARGPKSLKTLRYLFSIRDSIVTVLGNHDLHLLALAYHKPLQANYSIGKDLKPIFKAKDKIDLLEWLSHQPLVHYELELNTLLAHAGIYPLWSMGKTLKLAREVEEVLVDEKQRSKFFKNMHGNQPSLWSKNLIGYERLRFITNAFTRMRYVTKRCRLNLQNKSQLKQKPKTLIPWFKYPGRKLKKTPIVFGHWAALGYYKRKNILCLDSGCVWGNELTLVTIKE
ncbi:MAG: symmetrical bis(5'-nucleosyl)-tetraphosphatase [Gammaproteobacteria bacterium]|nr:symmetrical bis(5'-nucleosyl)-tetraphosphatase [Gammaproteobacteria bacterium]NNC96881.1 symmetrical bis(5'-nucleosyl)-tetraphosphatase [Gammaproteobacteria bacterium]NNM12769.1 symmetrical bis(5'-nucleosyl)-tetraphosphatase [Gammaproteobacteria bacterium]